MTLEEKIRAYAAKGELVHLSLVFSASGNVYQACFSAATPAGGFASGEDRDPVEAIEKAFKASPVAMPRIRREKITAAVSAGDTILPSEWTAP